MIRDWDVRLYKNVLRTSWLLAAFATAGCGDPTGPGGARPFTDLISITADAGKFVAVGTRFWGTDAIVPNSDTVVIMVSTDGEDWEAIDLERPGRLHSVAFGNGRYVAVGNHRVSGVGRDPVFPIVLTSTDGVAWTAADDVPSLGWRSVTFGNGTFVGTGTDSLLVETIATSTDGVTWTEEAVADILSVEVTFGNDRFVLWGESNGLGISSNGTDWTVVSLDEVSRVVDVALLDGRLIGSGMYDCCFGEVPGSIRYFALTSADGEAWTVQERQDQATIFFAHAFGAGRFVATASSEIFSSDDGETWTREIEIDDHVTDVAFGAGRFVAVGRVLAVSTDGSNWRTTRVPQ